MDLLSLIFENLGRRKARVAMTAIGVVIGTAAIVVLVSLGIGLQQSATDQLGGIGDLTEIQVYPNYGDGGPGGPVVFAGPGGPGQTPSTAKLLTDRAVKDIAAIPGVVSVIPRDYLQGGGPLKFGRLEGYGNLLGIGLSDLTTLGWEARRGELQLSKGQAVIGYQVPQQFYDPKLRPGQPPPPPPDLLDQTVKLTLIKFAQDGTQSTKIYTFRVVGVIEETRNEPDFSIYLPLEDITAMNQWVTGKRINRNKDGYSQLIVKVGGVEDALPVTDAINELGFQAYTPQSFVQGINNFFIILQLIFGGVGAIALLVAAIGIANTMTMAILERTREIGLMKAVGASNRDVLSVFLGEAGGIGFLGGLGGVALGWTFGFVLNTLIPTFLASQTPSGPGVVGGATFSAVTPIWLLVSSLVFATIIGVLSGLYPALRAATLVPVLALKYE
jgi:putative ABC transport system permease protein